ncbi:MAG: hypothetical protein GY866_34730 [Proteobacteria bacterium]|nr:hypothetical protein [Pseudomonadota bacterium]
MKNTFRNKRRGRKKSTSFKPNHQFIVEATEEFLKKGGRIDHLQPDEESFKNSWGINDVSSEVDDFLIGQ